jgi:hypothetical protein
MGFKGWPHMQCDNPKGQWIGEAQLGAHCERKNV